MANKGTALTDPELQSRLEDAYQQLVESLDQRKNRFFDPTWLAAAQAFAKPASTGSAFEALGNVAGAVGKSQEEESKKEFELNKAKFDINKELLAINQQRKRQEFGMGELGDTQPQPPGALPGKPPAGTLPGQPPTEGGALTSPVGAAPGLGQNTGIKTTPLQLEPQGNLPPPIKTPGTPQPELVTKPAPPPSPLAAPAAPAGALPPPPSAVPPPEDLRWGMTAAGRKVAKAAFGEGASFADAVKKGQEHDAAIAKRENDAEKLRIDREELLVKQGTLKDAQNKTAQGKYVKVGNTIVDTDTKKPVYIEGGNEVVIGGKTYPANPALATQFANATLNGDTAEVQRLGQEIIGGKPGTPKVLSKSDEATRVAEEAAARDVKTATEKKRLEEEVKKQREMVEKIPVYEGQRDNAKTAIEILNDKDVQKALGPLAGPGVVKAIGTLVSGGFKVGAYNVALENFDEALINIKASPETIVKINALKSTLRREELVNAQTFLKGEGPITNMERGIVQDLGGMVNKDPAAALLYKVQLAYAQAEVNERYAKSFEAWHEKNPTGMISDFNRSGTYSQIRKDYLNDLEGIRKQIGVGPSKAPAENKAVLTKLRDLVKSNANKVAP